MKFKASLLAIPLLLAMSANAELAPNPNLTNSNIAKQNLTELKDAEFNAQFKDAKFAAQRADGETRGANSNFPQSADLNSSQNFSQNTDLNLPQKATPIDEAKNLYRVDERLFRSAQLEGSDAAKLRELGVKSIINLRHFSRSGDKKAFGDEFWLANKPLRSWEIKPSQIAEILRTIRERQKEGAVLVHCYHGADRTGLVVAMYRVIYQGWSLDAARSEMIEGGYGFHSMWRDIAGFLTPQNEALVRAELGI